MLGRKVLCLWLPLFVYIKHYIFISFFLSLQFKLGYEGWGRGYKPDSIDFAGLYYLQMFLPWSLVPRSDGIRKSRALTVENVGFKKNQAGFKKNTKLDFSAAPTIWDSTRNQREPSVCIAAHWEGNPQTCRFMFLRPSSTDPSSFLDILAPQRTGPWQEPWEPKARSCCEARVALFNWVFI